MKSFNFMCWVGDMGRVMTNYKYTYNTYRLLGKGLFHENILLSFYLFHLYEILILQAVWLFRVWMGLEFINMFSIQFDVYVFVKLLFDMGFPEMCHSISVHWNKDIWYNRNKTFIHGLGYFNGWNINSCWLIDNIWQFILFI